MAQAGDLQVFRMREFSRDIFGVHATPTATEAATLLDDDLASELDNILVLEKPAQRAQKLQSSAKQCQGRPAAEMAESAYKRMVAEAQAAQK